MSVNRSMPVDDDALHYLDLPQRGSRPRDRGLTNVVDNGYGMQQTRDLLDLVHPYVDIIKLGWGSAYLTPDLKSKVALIAEYGVQVCPGGMLFELSYWQDKIDPFTRFLEAAGISMVEVSNGSLPIPDDRKCGMVELFRRRGFTVLSEVGSKDINLQSPPAEWVRAIRDDLAAGAWKVIMEGRADASAGIYTADGTLKDDLVETVLGSGIDADKLIFEAPHKRQMTLFIRRIGAEVNLGNVPLNEVLNLETLRLGLRGDTVMHFHAGRHP